MDVVTLNSGGLDSAVVLACVLKEHPDSNVRCLFVDYGQRTLRQEQRAAKRVCDYYSVPLTAASVCMPWIEDHVLLVKNAIAIDKDSEYIRYCPQAEGNPTDYIIPLRNLVLASMGCSFAVQHGAEELWVGWDWVNHTSSCDKSPAFAAALSDATRVGVEQFQRPVTIVHPLTGHLRVDTMRRARGLKVPVRMTWSCYNNFSKPCGFCVPCTARRAACKTLNFDEGISYLSPTYVKRVLS